MRFLTVSEDDTYEFGKSLGANLVTGDIVLLHGNLGAGKSVLARGIAGAHGVDCAMPSPTFTILIPYKGDTNIYHFDLYRLSDPDEFFAAGLEEYLGYDGIAIIEWPEMADINPKGAVKIDIARGKSYDERVISVSGKDMNGIDKWRYDDEHTVS